jgi:hypothetical protein
MNNLWDEKNGVFEVSPGANITATIAEAIKRARSAGREIVFEFNGVTVAVQADSYPELIHRDWSRSMSGYIGKRVGPYPSERLTSAELANDAKVEAKNEERRRIATASYEKKAAAKLAATEARLVGAPQMEFSDVDGWDQFKANNSDGYGGAVVSYAERWARLMQVDLVAGKRLEDIADSTSHEADLEGITGFMYGCAVSTLAHTWKHGEALRRWHNLKTQIRNEGERANESGGVLNPALLNLG